MKKTIHAIYSRTSFGHHDCLMLINATDIHNAIDIALKETTIEEVFDPDNIVAEDLQLTTNCDNYIKIFADDIEFN